MNKKTFALFLMLISISSYSQIDFGIRGGLNLNFSKEANIIGDFNFSGNSENALGFHLGVLSEFEIQKPGLSIRPEILYTNITYDYTGLIDPDSQSLTIQKLDIPVLLGIKITGPFRLLIGPSLQFIIDTDFDVRDFEEINKQAFSLNAQLGLGLKFERFDVDIRWEKGLSNTESNFVTDIANVGVNFDTNPNQLILGVSYRFALK